MLTHHIEALRVDRGISLSALYRATGVSPDRWERMYRKRLPVPYRWADGLAELFGRPAEDFRWTPRSLSELLDVHEVTTTEAACRTGILRESLYKVRKGERPLSRKIAKAIDKAFGWKSSPCARDFTGERVEPLPPDPDEEDEDDMPYIDKRQKVLLSDHRKYHDFPLFQRMMFEEHLRKTHRPLHALLSRSDAEAWLAVPDGERQAILGGLRRVGGLGRAAAEYAEEARRP